MGDFRVGTAGSENWMGALQSFLLMACFKFSREFGGFHTREQSRELFSHENSLENFSTGINEGMC